MKKLCVLVVLSFILSCFQVAFAQDIYLGIPGYTEMASTTKSYENYSELTSMQFGFTATTSVSGTGGSGAGKPSLPDIPLTKKTDLSTTKLIKAGLLGTAIPKAEIVVVRRDQDQTPIYKISLTNVFITNYSASASSGCGECPAESLSLTYQTITITTYIQDSSGKITQSSVTYDRRTNKVN